MYQNQLLAARILDATLSGHNLTDVMSSEAAHILKAKVIGSVSFVVFMLIGALLFSVTRYWQFMLVLGTFGPAFVLWFASQYLARIKRGRPDGYYTQAIHLWLAHRGLATPKFLIYHGWWGLGRSLDLSLASAFEPPPEKFSPPPHSDRVSHVQP